MKYNQPYGITDPNAAYINGNPTTGTMGSIPPAASIEYPQREIVALIAAAGLTPDNADLAQVLKAIKLVDVLNVFKQAHQRRHRRGLGDDVSDAADHAAAGRDRSLLQARRRVRQRRHDVLAQRQRAEAGGLRRSLAHPHRRYRRDRLAAAVFDGANWQVIAGSSRAPGMLPPLFAITNWYVNGTTGDDAAYDGTAATHTSANHGPFRTIQRAADETLKYNMNGFDQFVNVADYGAGYANFDCKQTNGSGTVWFIGNEANPQNVPVTAATPNTHAIHQLGGFYAFKGFRLSATGSGNCSWPCRQRRQRSVCQSAVRSVPERRSHHRQLQRAGSATRRDDHHRSWRDRSAAYLGKHQFQHLRRSHAVGAEHPGLSEHRRIHRGDIASQRADDVLRRSPARRTCTACNTTRSATAWFMRSAAVRLTSRATAPE